MRTKPGGSTWRRKRRKTPLPQGHQALLVGVGGVSPAKGDLVAGERDEAMVGDGDAMGVGTQVVEDILGAAKGRLAVDHPLVAEQGAQEGRESFR